MNVTMIWFLGLPILVGLSVWYFLPRDGDGAKLGALNAGIGIILVIIAFVTSSGIATWDTEIWSGQIVSKDRDHGTYEQPYSCNCRTVTSGSGQNATTSTQCDTCYETHYTVKWSAESTVGPFSLFNEDSTSRSVYRTPDPARYTIIKPGDPASVSHRYTNYVQAVPESLFTPSSAGLKAKFGALIPAYPDRIYDFYKVDRFLTPGFSTPDAALWNAGISNMLRGLGPQKQVNTIVVIAKTDDPNYEYALRDAWEGANKNDVVLIIGSTAWPKIDFVRVLSWTKNELFKIELRDNIQALESIQREPILGLLSAQISKNFDRRKMSEFKYLESEIDPPVWVLVSLGTLLCLGGVLCVLMVSGFFDRFRRTSKRGNLYRR